MQQHDGFGRFGATDMRNCARSKKEEKKNCELNDIDTHLEKQLDSLDGGYGGFGDGSGGTTSQEVLGEGNGCVTHLQMLSDSVRSLGFACGVEMADAELEESGFKGTGREKNCELRLPLPIGCQRWLVGGAR